MKRAGGDGGLRHHLRERLLPRLDEDGIGLIEILMGFVVFMICFLPILMFLPTGARVIVNSTNQRYATAIANTTLANAQNSTIPPAWSSTQSPPTWSGTTGTQSVQNGVTFEIYTLAGWCAFNPNTNGWDTTWHSGDHASYRVVVKVGWGRNMSSTATTNVVVDSTELASTTTAPAPGDPTSCPPLGAS